MSVRGRAGGKEDRKGPVLQEDIPCCQMRLGTSGFCELGGADLRDCGGAPPRAWDSLVSWALASEGTVKELSPQELPLGFGGKTMRDLWNMPLVWSLHTMLPAQHR